MSRPAREGYHHGDLRRALVAHACEALEAEGVEAFSLRGVAARAGVSHNAPYRHFADRTALLSAAAQQGFEDLAARLTEASEPGTPLVGVGRAYLDFAARRPHMYRLMFGSDVIRPAGEPDPELRSTSRQTFTAFTSAVAACIPQSESEYAGAVAAILWADLHGMALLLVERRIQPWMTGGVPHERIVAAHLSSLEVQARAAAAHLGRAEG